MEIEVVYFSLQGHVDSIGVRNIVARFCGDKDVAPVARREVKRSVIGWKIVWLNT